MRGIVSGQRIDPIKADRARQLRRDMTPAERVLWERLRARRCAGLKFRRQQVIRGFIVDFYCEEHGLVVEIDGPVHQLRHAADRERDGVLRGLGLEVARFSNEEVVEHVEAVCRAIARRSQR
jgi:very-short-patch-repair endonuclease